MKFDKNFNIEYFKDPTVLVEFFEYCKEKQNLDLLETKAAELLSVSLNWESKTLKNYIDFLLALIKPIETNLETYDCCGTGGDATGTFNISTAAAIITAATKINIAKNGGRSSSSKTGSVDVLESLGVNLNLNDEKKLEALKKFHLAFFSSKISAEILLPIKNSSRKNKQASFVSLIAPFISPIKIKSQIVGIGRRAWLEPVKNIAQELIQDGLREKIILVFSEDSSGRFFDELIPSSKAFIHLFSQKQNSVIELNTEEITKSDFDFENIKSENSEESSRIIQEIFEPNYSENTLDTKNTAALNSALLRVLAQEQELSREILNHHYLESLESIANSSVKNNWQKFLDFTQQN